MQQEVKLAYNNVIVQHIWLYNTKIPRPGIFGLGKN